MVGEGEEPPQPVVGDLLDWDKTHRLPLISVVSPPLKSPSSMVAIRNHKKHGCKDPPIVFPPADHENLHISPDLRPTAEKIPHIHDVNKRLMFSDSDSDSDSNSNSSSSFSPSESSPVPRSPLIWVRPAADAAGWFGSMTEIFNSKVNVLMQFFCSMFTSSRSVFPTFRFAAFTAILVAFLYFRRRRLRAGQESRDRLIGIIKERDEKINQLLDQLSRMNQVLLAVHKVPTP